MSYLATVANSYQDTAKTKIEFRLGGDEPVNGFSEMAFFRSQRKAFVSPQIIIANHDIASATVDTSRITKEPVISVVLTQEASVKFADFTEKHINQPLAIIVNGRIMSMPIIRQRIYPGLVLIAGKFTREEADQFVNDLK